jgi:hypothetical protein
MCTQLLFVFVFWWAFSGRAKPIYLEFIQSMARHCGRRLKETGRSMQKSFNAGGFQPQDNHHEATFIQRRQW